MLGWLLRRGWGILAFGISEELFERRDVNIVQRHGWLAVANIGRSSEIE